MGLQLHDFHFKHWNPGASMPLVLRVREVVCNTSDEAIYANVRANSRLPDKLWIRYVEPHDGVAILCGSGPSLADTLGEIRERIAAGGKVFAMNGAAKYLNDNGIMPDYQVILDARIETAQLIGPAREHLFASQVHPELFRRVPDARLWQLEVGGIDDLLPEYDKGYALIGGAASVGNTATCLAYAMGYRNLQLYGYDSSHRDDKSHAFRQLMNDGEPCAHVDWGGKTYLISITMKVQAEKFQLTARALKAEGCSIEVHGSGLLPDMYNAPRVQMTEREKYERLYAMDEYRLYSPGERRLELFLREAKPKGSVIDFGCGTGRAALKMAEAGLAVTMIDFAKNAPDKEALRLPFLRHDMTQPIPASADYGYCVDMMEHISPDDVDTVLRNIMQAARTVFFQICTAVETMGELIGQELHLTVENHFWWAATFRRLGYQITLDARIEAEAESLFIVTHTETTSCQA